MKTLNISSKRFLAGKKVKATKDYLNGNAKVSVGDKGTIRKVTIESFPGMLLFNLRIVYMDFEKCSVNMEEKIAEEYFKVISDRF